MKANTIHTSLHRGPIQFTATRPSKPRLKSVSRFHSPLGWFAILSSVLALLHLVAWRFDFFGWLLLAETLSVMVGAMIASARAERRALHSFNFQLRKWESENPERN